MKETKEILEILESVNKSALLLKEIASKRKEELESHTSDKILNDNQK